MSAPARPGRAQTIVVSQTHTDAHAGASAVSALSSRFQLPFGVAGSISLLGALVALALRRADAQPAAAAAPSAAR